jgi:hypothetical protein
MNKFPLKLEARLMTLHRKGWGCHPGGKEKKLPLAVSPFGVPAVSEMALATQHGRSERNGGAPVLVDVGHAHNQEGPPCPWSLAGDLPVHSLCVNLRTTIYMQTSMSMTTRAQSCYTGKCGVSHSSVCALSRINALPYGIFASTP